MHITIKNLKYGVYIDNNNRSFAYRGPKKCNGLYKAYDIGECFFIHAGGDVTTIMKSYPILVCWDGVRLLDIDIKDGEPWWGHYNRLMRVRNNIKERMAVLAKSERTPEKIRNIILLENL